MQFKITVRPEGWQVLNPLAWVFAMRAGRLLRLQFDPAAVLLGVDHHVAATVRATVEGRERLLERLRRAGVL